MDYKGSKIMHNGEGGGSQSKYHWLHVPINERIVLAHSSFFPWQSSINPLRQ